jgi:glycosyltransferase involved in cell wall biosynthesis
MPLVSVITPYHKEGVDMIRRCMASVEAQEYPGILHYLVADGFPRPELMAGAAIRHIVLPGEHRDNGDTPRGIGALCALNGGADIVCFLDADNFYERDHVASVVDAFEHVGGDAVLSERSIMPRGHEALRLVDPEDARGTHVDTSCISLSASAAFLWPVWSMLPQVLSPIGDRVVMSIIRHHNLRCTRTRRRTVVFDSAYRYHFQLAGLSGPESPHDPVVGDVRRAYDPADAYARLHLNLSI